MDGGRLLSFMLFAKAAILMVLGVILAVHADWLLALGMFGLGLLILLAARLVRRRGY